MGNKGDIDLSMTSDRDGLTDTGERVPAGTTVLYEGHVPAGMVRIRLPNGSGSWERLAVMHPQCFPQLRE
jgi:hypothetical protein